MVWSCLVNFLFLHFFTDRRNFRSRGDGGNREVALGVASGKVPSHRVEVNKFTTLIWIHDRG